MSLTLVTSVQVGDRLQLFQVPTPVRDVKRYFGLAEDTGCVIDRNGEEVDVLGRKGPYTLEVDLALVSKNKKAVDQPAIRKRGRPRLQPPREPSIAKKRGRPPKKLKAEEELPTEPKPALEEPPEALVEEPDLSSSEVSSDSLGAHRKSPPRVEPVLKMEVKMDEVEDEAFDANEANDSNESEAEVEKILASGIGSDGKKLYLIWWKGDEETWEPADNIDPQLVREYEKTQINVNNDSP